MREIDILRLDIPALEAEVRRHNQLYWQRNDPEIADELYDLLVRRLRELAPRSRVLDELGEEPAPDARPAPAGKVRHLTPMLSLEKAYSEPEVLRFFERFQGPALASPKVDGLAVSLRYGPDGHLRVAATRGSGIEGDDVTAAARRVLGVPHRIDAADVEIRGEVHLPLTTFRNRYAEQFANPRNLAAGALKQKDPDRTAAYGLRFLAYDLLQSDARSESDKRTRMAGWSFDLVPAVLTTAETALRAFEGFIDARDTLDYETDGVVLKVDDVRQHDALGITAHHPRYAIAWKFQGESGLTTLRGVEWSVSRTGTVNPVALLDPVVLSGVTVARVSLHNLGIMEQLAGLPIRLGDNFGHPLSSGATVLVTRRGGVIPHIEGLADGGSANLIVPESCPSCGAPTSRRDDFLIADHTPDCAVQRRRRLEHFVQTVDMQGFGPRVLDQLQELGLVSQPSDLYTLRSADLASLERLGERSAANLVAAVDARRVLDPATFLAALGIPDVGVQVARSLVAHHPDLTALRRATADELLAIDGVGAILASRIVDGLDHMRDEIDRLLAVVGLRAADATEATDGPLLGRSFVFTGALDSMSRSEAQSRVRALGGTTPEAVTATTTDLVLGDADHARFVEGWRSSKLKKADQLIARGSPLRVISETEFLQLTREAP